MENAEATTKAQLTSDVLSAWRAIGNRTTLATTKARQKYWRPWQNTSVSGTKTNSLTMPLSWSKASSPQLLLQGSGWASTADDIRSRFHQSQMCSWLSPRPSNWLENTVQCAGRKKNTSS
eukprot:7688108-Ditylum_brightwellii.AAC.1